MSSTDLENAAHVWFCYPDEITDSNKIDEYQALLSAQEKKKQQGFHSVKDRHSYLVSHALLRKVLSRYCVITPQQLTFTHNQHGKPELLLKPGSPTIKFNLSHTDGLSACVVSLDTECGIDVENNRREKKFQAIAKRMFAPQEQQTLQALDKEEQRKQFFSYWTLREAYVKALGTGLAGSSRQFFFTLDKNDQAEIGFLEDADKNSGSANDWQFDVMQPSEHFTLAVALRLNQSQIKKIQYQQLVP